MQHIAKVLGPAELDKSQFSSGIRWARRPLASLVGHCVAVALYRGRLTVAIETPEGDSWLLAELVADDDALDAWARTGF